MRSKRGNINTKAGRKEIETKGNKDIKQQCGRILSSYNAHSRIWISSCNAGVSHSDLYPYISKGHISACFIKSIETAGKISLLVSISIYVQLNNGLKKNFNLLDNISKGRSSHSQCQRALGTIITLSLCD